MEIPLAGNAYITQKEKGAPEVITECGLGNWMSSDSICSIFFRPCHPGEIELSLLLSVPNGGTSLIMSTITTGAGDDTLVESCQVEISGEESHEVYLGTFNVLPTIGYAKVDLQGIDKSEGFFGDVSHLIVKYLTTDGDCGEINHVDESFDFHFGRRGPSVHLNYSTPDDADIEYFYNEVTVPEAQDVKGSYFCAIGFSGGYFGIQVNSSCERRVLFSVWSDFATDNPDDIPDDFKVSNLKAGEGVHMGEFGNEGSGAQSYLLYNWKPEVTYKFLLFGKPMEENHSIFTAWFFDPEEPQWRLIASFEKPKVSTYLKGLYSFSENFKPKKGHIERKAYFGNQWSRDSNGEWAECTEARFTGDETAKSCRKDVAGGIENGKFYLRNCGFFNDCVETNQTFCRCSTNACPSIDFDQLP